MHDLRRSGNERAGVEQLFLVVDEHGHAAFEHVERIHVPPVEVRVGAVARVRKVRLGDRQLVEARLEHDPAAEERLAFTGPEHDSVHRGRV